MGLQKRVRDRLSPRLDDGRMPEFDGHEVRLRGVDTRRFGASRRAATRYVILELGGPIGVMTHARRVTPWLRLARRLGLANPAPSGDPAFDRQVHVECDDPGYLRELLASRARRAAFIDLLNATPRPAAIALGDQGAWLHLPGDAVPGDAELQVLLPLLRNLRRNLPKEDGRQQAVRKSHRRQFWYAIAFMVAFLGSVVAAGLIRPPKTPGMSLVPGVVCGTLFLLVVLGIGWVRLRGRTGATTEIRLVAILTVVAAYFFGLAGWRTAAWLNAHDDVSTGTVHVQQVVDKHVKRTRNGSVYRMVTISPWNPGQDPLDIEVSRAEHDIIQISRPVRIVTHPGAYGWEWIEPIDWAPPEPESSPQ